MPLVIYGVPGRRRLSPLHPCCSLPLLPLLIAGGTFALLLVIDGLVGSHRTPRLADNEPLDHGCSRWQTTTRMDEPKSYTVGKIELEEDPFSTKTRANPGKDHVAPVPFFGRQDAESAKRMASHLEHRVDEYRQDLVKVVQGLDLIITRLEEAAASAGTGDRDMPGDGMRRLAAKLRRKLEKTPPRWQVNTDVLSWLLRPVPFIAGLPAPRGVAPPAPRNTAPGGYDDLPAAVESQHVPTKGAEMADGVAQESGTKCGDDGDGHGGAFRRDKVCRTTEDGGAGKGASDGGAAGFDAKPAREATSMSAREEGEGGERDGAAASGAVGKGETAPEAVVRERRAAPIVQGPAATVADALEELSKGKSREWGGGEQQNSSANRPGFSSYDETHQIFTHVLRDWTSEGRSVRAAVYDPLIQALDAYVGWQEVEATGAAATAPSGTGGYGDGNSMAGEWKRAERDQPRRKRTRRANVLVPGAGLGRLAAEIAARGYASVHANELSPTMLASCYWLMEALRGDDRRGGWRSHQTSSPREDENGDGHTLFPAPSADSTAGHDADVDGAVGSGKARGAFGGGGGAKDRDGGNGGEFTEGRGQGEKGLGFFEFFPFLNDVTHNEMDGGSRFRSALFPDPDGRAVLARASGRLSFQAGEFSAMYGAVGGPFEGAFDAVVTSFFIDTAPNVVEYIATIRRTLRSGGVWINCGPLHWHTTSALALSLDEMLALVAGSGFRLEAVERLPPCAYRVQDEEGSLRVDEFRPVFWVATLD